MNLSNSSEVKNSRSRRIKDGSTWIKTGIVLVLIILYIAAFPLTLNKIGIVGTAFIAIPAATAGWFFGIKAGLVTSLLSIILNTTLLAIFQDNNWMLWFGSGWPGNLMVILVGLISGRLSEIIRQYKQVETDLRLRERHLILLRMATNNILNPQKIEERYYYLINHLVNLFVADYGYFFHWDENQQQAVLAASTTLINQSFPDITLKAGESALTESILQAERILVIDNSLYSQDTFNATLFKDHAHPIGTVLSIPIITRKHKLAMVILVFNMPCHFTPDEINQYQEAIDQIALVLWTVNQEIEIQKRLRETNTIARIGQALSETERIGLQTVLQLIVTSAQELIPKAEQAVIHLLDKEEQILEAQAVSGYEGATSNWKLIKIQPNEGVAGQVLVSGETINIPDIRKDSRFVTYSEPPKYRSLMVAPVQSGEQKLGTISVQSALISAFTEDESRLLSTLGTQAAIAIENAHLLESIQQALKESNALYRINQGLVTSLDPNQLIKDTVELLQKNFGYHYVQIYVAELESGDFVMRAGSGKIGAQLKALGHRIAAGDGIVGYTAETGTSFFTNNVDDVVSFIRNPLLPDTKSELAVPVKADGTILGMLDIHQVPPKYLSHRDIQLVSAVADQLSVALQKANLYENLQISLQQEKAIRNQLMQNERLAVMGRLLATVSHELNNPLQAIQNALFLLKEETNFSPQARQDLEIVLAESERMANMIERLRATYRPIQAEDFILTQVNNLIEDVYALISTHLRHNQIIFEFQPDPELPAIPALADQIRQVVLNLLMNAVESMTTGGKLTVCTALLQDTNEILLSVSDTGKGIPADLLPNIFEAFVTDKQRGTGLGLTISYDIVMKHNGRISAENNPYEGALFKVWLPTDNSEKK